MPKPSYGDLMAQRNALQSEVDALKAEAANNPPVPSADQADEVAKLQDALNAANAELAETKMQLEAAQGQAESAPQADSDGKVTVRLTRDIWAPNRIAAGTTVALPLEEALAALESGSAKRA